MKRITTIFLVLLTIFVSCTSTNRLSTIDHRLSTSVNIQPGGSILVGCTPIATGGTTPVPPSGAGGQFSVSGGQSSTGGLSAIGGRPSAGGSPSNTGGTTACTSIVYPTTQSASLAKKGIAVTREHHPKMPRHHKQKHNRSHRAIARGETANQGCSVWYQPPWTPLNQLNYGACTGNAWDGCIATPPLGLTQYFGESFALTYYEWGTCEDNGCAVPSKCSCTACPASFCLASDANDNGSTGGSVAQALTTQGIIKGFAVADTVSDLVVALETRSCVIGVNWYNSMFTPTSSGQLQVTVSSGLAGGHEIHVVGHDAILSRTWIENSWGLWGLCFQSEVISQTPTDGTGCGYAWIADSDLPKLDFDGDCPDL